MFPQLRMLRYVPFKEIQAGEIFLSITPQRHGFFKKTAAVDSVEALEGSTGYQRWVSFSPAENVYRIIYEDEFKRWDKENPQHSETIKRMLVAYSQKDIENAIDFLNKNGVSYDSGVSHEKFVEMCKYLLDKRSEKGYD